MARTPRVPDGPPPAPAVQRLRVRYAKRGRMRFTSTRDFQRALERAVRRAGVPMAYSGGFHPHPKISYANAAPTGTASEAEYVELLLREVVDLAGLDARLDDALPPGLDVVSVTEVTSVDAASLADQLQASRWALRFRGAGLAVTPAEVSAALRALLEVDALHVSRLMKQGPRDLDVRAAIVDLHLADGPDAVALPTEPGDVVVLALVRHTTPTIRPAELWTALRSVSGLDLPQPVSTRLEQGPLGESDARGALLGPGV